MEITPEAGDAEAFIIQVAAITNGLLQEHAPQMFVLIKVNSWFGFKWLGFSGKALGRLGVWRDVITVPPFTPSRIVSQRRFVQPDYEEIPAGRSIHQRVRTTEALRRSLAEIEPNAALIWYSGDSNLTGRGAAMAYIPTGDTYRCWYSSWSGRGIWHIEKTLEISREELESLMDSSGHPVRADRAKTLSSPQP